MRSRILAISLLLLIGLVPAIHSPARAADINVACNTADLIAAINTANGNGQADTLNLASGCVYNFTTAMDMSGTYGDSALPRITTVITINGNGATLERASGSPSFRLLHIAGDGDLTVDNIIITSGGTIRGGGIYNTGTLTVTNTTITGNTAISGGGIANEFGGTVTAIDSTFSSNTASNGGGIENHAGTVTITNSTINGNTAVSSGGGVYNFFGAALTITNSTISDNVSSGHGGGLHVWDGSTTTVINTTFSGNVSSSGSGGGAIYNHSGALVVIYSTFDGNRADTNSHGGAIRVDGGSTTISGSTFSNNASSGVGGALYLSSSSAGFNASISDSLFVDNQAANSGGAIEIGGSVTITLTNVEMRGNSTSGNGGAINNYYGTVRIHNSALTGNSGVDGGAVWNSGTLVVSGSTLAGNNAGRGGGLFNYLLGSATIANSVIWGNSSGIATPVGTYSVTYSIVQGGIAGTGNLAENPLFISPTDFTSAPTTLGDYHLSRNSPGVDSGSNASVFGITDLDGNPRIVYGVVDRGAYELQLPDRVSASPLTVSVTEGGATDTYAVVLLSEPTANVIVSPSGDAQCSVSGTLTFTPDNWDTPQDVTVTAVDDGVAEGMHACTIANTATSADPNFDGTYSEDVEGVLTDNDVAGASVNPITVSITEDGATDTYAIMLTSEPTSDVTVTPMVGAQCLVTDALTFTPSNWDTPQDVTVTAVDDGLAEGTHTCLIANVVTSADLYYDWITVDGVTGVITDNDTVDSIVACNTTALIGSIDAANRNGVPDTLNLAAGCVYNFTSGYATHPDSALPPITSAITIYGNGATLQRDSTASTDFRLIYVTDLGNLDLRDATISGGYTQDFGGGILNAGTMVVANSTITGNSGSSAVSAGGGISNSGTMTITSSIFSGNGGSIWACGGIHNDVDSTLTLTESTLSSNGTVVSVGGGICNYGILTVTNSTISGNVSDNTAGGIYSEGTTTVTGSTFSGNSAGIGGGIVNGLDGTTTVVNSTFSGNNASVGGGISTGGEMTVINSTISGNSAAPCCGLSYSFGGGIYHDLGNLWIINSTIAGNRASAGGGIYKVDYGTVTVVNSVIWGNSTQTHGGIGFSYTIVEGGIPGGELLNVDPLFVAPEPPANAPTTAGDYHLQANSPAKNAGSNAALPADLLDLDGDQNTSEPIPRDLDGGKRISGGIVDMGAYEIQDPDGITVSPLTVSVTEGGATDTYAVVLLSEPTANVIVSPSGDAQCSVSGTLTFTPDNWITPQDVTVTAVDDDVAEGMHACTITNTATSADPSFDGTYSEDVEGALTDNDVAGASVNPITVSVTEDGATDTYAIMLTSEPTADVTVTPMVSAQCLVTDALTFTPSNWDTPQDVTVTAVDDGLDEGTHTCLIANVVTSADLYYDWITVDGVTGVITDNDTVDSIVACNTTALIGSIDAANRNGVPDTLNLAAGCVYNFTTAADIDAEWGDSALPRITSAITIYGNGATIQRDSTASTDFRLFNVTELGNLDLRDATISGGYTHDVGGAILSSGIVSVTNSTISGNSGSSSSSTSAGAGGIFSSGTLTITGSIISGNGANIWACAGVFNGGTMTLVDSTLSNNGPAIAGGGGICNHGTLTVTNSAITDNTSENSGGGLSNSGGRLTIVSSTLSGNSAGTCGAIYSEDGNIGSKIIVVNSSITGNSAGIGGGICNGSKMTIVNSSIIGNSAQPTFGVTYSRCGGIYNGRKMTIINSTIAGNRGSEGGVICNEGGTLTVTNSIVWGNESLVDDSGTWTVTHSLIEGGFTGTGNLDADPLFVAPEPFANAPTTAGDYHIQALSPARNVGSNAALPADTLDLDGDLDTGEPIPFDRDGNKRIAGGIVDMGAYEIQPVELIVNGSFEAGIAPWAVTTLGGDKVKDKNPYDGLFAFRFKGFAGKPSAKLKQTILTPTIADGDVVTASAFIRSGLSANGKMTLKIKTDLGGKFKGKVAFDKSGAYALHQIDVPITLGIGETVANIKLQFKDKSQSGKVYVDAVSVTVDVPPAPRAITRAPVLPPPAAPGGFRGGN